MLFNSFQYVFLFLPVVALAYGLLRTRVSARASQFFLLLASCFFYGFHKPSNLGLLFASIIFNWGVARVLSGGGLDERTRKLVFWMGLGVDIAFLFSFKYINLFLQGIAFFHGPSVVLPDLEFPLGISFFTLSQIMYLVDTYQSPETANSLLDHFSFVSFFPYVTSGPIARSTEVVPQLTGKESQADRLTMACRGLFLFTLGLAKKVVFADSFARVADAGFRNAVSYSTLEAWTFCLAFTFQIYFDFSGYSDMAMGSAMMLGIRIPKNFDAPFRALSISEYWQRWHMSLSAFITSYLYTPILRAMGGRATVRKSAIATVAAMGIAGIWHGPSWTFAVYGLVHGIALSVNQIWKRRKIRMPDGLSWLITFVFVNLSFVLFRSPTLSSAGRFYSYMLPHGDWFGVQAFEGVLPIAPSTLLRPVVVGLVIAFLFRTSTDLAEDMPLKPSRSLAVAALLLVSVLYMNSTAAKTFIYFAF